MPKTAYDEYLDAADDMDDYFKEIIVESKAQKLEVSLQESSGSGFGMARVPASGTRMMPVGFNPAMALKALKKVGTEVKTAPESSKPQPAKNFLQPQKKENTAVPLPKTQNDQPKQFQHLPKPSEQSSAKFQQNQLKPIKISQDLTAQKPTEQSSAKFSQNQLKPIKIPQDLTTQKPSEQSSAKFPQNQLELVKLRSKTTSQMSAENENKNIDTKRLSSQKDVIKMFEDKNKPVASSPVVARSNF